jgi:hypothetical protein
MKSVGKALVFLFLFGCMVDYGDGGRVRAGASVRFNLPINSLEIKKETVEPIILTGKRK